MKIAIMGFSGSGKSTLAKKLGEKYQIEVLYGGSWMSDSQYGTIHRVASDGTEKGIFTQIVNFARERFAHLRIDTHEQNLTKKP